MSKRKPTYKAKETREIAIPCDFDLTIETGKSSGITDMYELLDQYGMPTGKTKAFSPEELETV